DGGREGKKLQEFCVADLMWPFTSTFAPFEQASPQDQAEALLQLKWRMAEYDATQKTKDDYWKQRKSAQEPFMMNMRKDKSESAKNDDTLAGRVSLARLVPQEDLTALRKIGTDDHRFNSRIPNQKDLLIEYENQDLFFHLSGTLEMHEQKDAQTPEPHAPCVPARPSQDGRKDPRPEWSKTILEEQEQAKSEKRCSNFRTAWCVPERVAFGELEKDREVNEAKSKTDSGSREIPAGKGHQAKQPIVPGVDDFGGHSWWAAEQKSFSAIWDYGWRVMQHSDDVAKSEENLVTKGKPFRFRDGTTDSRGVFGFQSSGSEGKSGGDQLEEAARALTYESLLDTIEVEGPTDSTAAKYKAKTKYGIINSKLLLPEN
ncbi:unnamed protein product, partial [Amoebophrya sp. A120]